MQASNYFHLKSRNSYKISFLSLKYHFYVRSWAGNNPFKHQCYFIFKRFQLSSKKWNKIQYKRTVKITRL